MNPALIFVDACRLTSDQAKGKPFEVLTPGRRHQMVSSPLHLEEINRAPLDVLSLHAVAKDVSCSNDASRFQKLYLTRARTVSPAQVHHAWIRVERYQGHGRHGVCASSTHNPDIPSASITPMSQRKDHRSHRWRTHQA
jgi:hypothetical protein